METHNALIYTKTQSFIIKIPMLVKLVRLVIYTSDMYNDR